MRLVVCVAAACAVGWLAFSTGCVAEDDRPVRPRPRPNYEGKPRPAPGLDPFRKLVRQLRDGMSRSEVHRIFGEPQRVVTGSGFQKWRYGHPKRVQLVLTFRDGRLRNWGLGD